jgi:hypothetical protein
MRGTVVGGVSNATFDLPRNKSDRGRPYAIVWNMNRVETSKRLEQFHAEVSALSIAGGCVGQCALFRFRQRHEFRNGFHW